jgi:hypothetical protein
MVAYRLAAAVTLLFVVAALAFSGVRLLRNMPAANQYGFETTGTPATGPLVATVLPEGRAAGLRLGDHVLALDGAPIPKGRSSYYLGALLARQTGDIRALSVQQPGGPVRAVALHRQANIWLRPEPQSRLPMGVIYLVYFLQLTAPMVLLLSASVFLHERRPKDPEAVFLAFCFLLLCFKVEAFDWAFMFLGLPASLFETLSRVGWGATAVAVACLPGGRITSRWGLATLIVSALSLVCFLPLAALVMGDRMALAANSALLALSLVLAVVTLFARYRSLADPSARQQIKWALGGAGVAAVLIVVWLGLAMSTSAGLLHLPPWGYFLVNTVLRFAFIAAFPIGMMISVLRFRLYDSDAAIANSIAYAGLSMALVAVFAASENMLWGMGARAVQGQFGGFTAAMAASITAVAIAPLRERFKSFSQKRFRKDLFRLRDQLPSLVADMRETTELRHLAHAAMDRVTAGVRACRVVMLVGEDTLLVQGAGTAEEPLVSPAADDPAFSAWRAAWTPHPDKGVEIDRRDPLYPVRIPLVADGAGLVGWLLLGPRPDGSLYGREERKALGHIADPLARALAIAGERAARHDRTDARLAQMEAMIARLAARASL